jgi:FLYWCH zinc finger domain
LFLTRLSFIIPVYIIKSIAVDETLPTYLYNTEGVVIAKTQRGRTMLIYEGYKYVENRQSKKNHFWRCARYVKHGCRATLVTAKHMNTTPLIRTSGNPHSHPEEQTYDRTVMGWKSTKSELLSEDLNIIEMATMNAGEHQLQYSVLQTQEEKSGDEDGGDGEGTTTLYCVAP